MTNSIDSSLFLSSVQNKQKEKVSGNTLGQDAFLKLLITQLQNQDPSKPMEDTQFISQMATFSELEQMMAVNENIEKLISMQSNQQIMAYNQLLGKEVDWQTITYAGEIEDAQPVIENGTGKITSISISNNQPVLQLDDGTELLPEHIKGIGQLSNENSIVRASYVIGKQVSWETVDGIQVALVQSVSKKDGQILFNVNDENNTQLKAEQLLTIELV